MNIRFNNYSMWVSKKYNDDWYEWCVFVDEGSDIINVIKSIEYTLHPSFPDPVRLVTSKGNKFALFSSGWGGFSVKIRVNYEDGSSTSTSYFLKLDGSWPIKKSLKEFPDSDTQNVYDSLIHEKFRWRKLETLIKNSNLAKDDVLKVLDYLEREELARKASFLSVDGKEMWGSTAIVGVSPKLR